METFYCVFFILQLFSFKSYYVVWKLDKKVFLYKIYSQFKSYYVVWKLFIMFFFIHIFLCLNRTMQYGNAFPSSHVYHLITRFKSYYVVWKLDTLFIQNETFQTFKSYYVVWKQESILRVSFCLPCLNRTMQYGNTPIVITPLTECVV